MTRSPEVQAAMNAFRDGYWLKSPVESGRILVCKIERLEHSLELAQAEVDDLRSINERQAKAMDEKAEEVERLEQRIVDLEFDVRAAAGEDVDNLEGE